MKNESASNAETRTNPPEVQTNHRPPTHITLTGIRDASLHLYDACLRAVEFSELVERGVDTTPEIRLKARISRMFLQQAIDRAKGAL